MLEQLLSSYQTFMEISKSNPVVAGAIGLWGWIGILPLLTGSFRFCPAYIPFGISTCKTSK